MGYPMIIQGGMGAAVSNWRLANAVARLGQLGVVSSTGMETVLVRRLQEGDPGGEMRQALAHFPIREISQKIVKRYFVPGGKPAKASFKLAPMYTLKPRRDLLELTVAANFVEVYLAKLGHDGLVGINLMEKIQLPTLPALYGAMLAGVDYVLMGAGIPREIPGALDGLALHREVSLKIHVHGESPDDDFRMRFNPRSVLPLDLPALKRPLFLAVIASYTLAISLAKKANGKVDGFVIEGPVAGGHNAPPRGALQLNERGEPVYGPRDEVDLAKMRELGLPFWLAGLYAEPARIQQALAQGAQGVQVGTVFALCEESGLAKDLKQAMLRDVLNGSADVLTDPLASPTGFPFKTAMIAGTLSDPALYALRPRTCDLGYLRTVYKREDGSLGFRCPGEPVDAFVEKGGALAETVGRKCLCNGFIANIGIGQVRKSGYQELALVTIGDDLRRIGRLFKDGSTAYTAADVIAYLTGAPAA